MSSMFRTGWQQRGAHDELARELQRPIHPKTNPPELFKPVKVLCKRSFYAGGKPIDVGEVVSVEAHLARDLVAVGKAELA
jgi:hypothetical protein